MIGQRVGRYRVLQKIGKGGMGDVYLAEDSTLGRKVALKFISSSLQSDEVAHKRFIREARSAAGLDHPFICNVHEVDRDESKQDFIVMEFVPGKSLDKIVAKGPMPVPEALQVLQETAEALQEAHSHGIVHRDLKPSNIMISTGGHPKVMDFGLAKRTEQLDDPEITSLLTEEGQVLGTPAYMSPEQLRGDPSDNRADIFSLGVIGLQMLTGTHPFRKTTTAASVSAILRDSPEGLDSLSIPEEVRDILSRMLQKDPRRRYPDCSQLLEDIRKAIGILSYPTVPIFPFQKRWWRANKRAILLVTFAAAFLLGVIFHKSIIDRFQLAPLPGNITLAVLPPRLEEKSEKEEAFAAGLTETLALDLTHLSLTHPFNVVPTTLVREKGLHEPEFIAEKLGANLALLASFNLTPEKIVEIELILTPDRSDRRLRHTTVSGRYEDPAALQTMLVEESVKMLGSVLNPSDRQSVFDVGFRNARAYHFYLTGIGYQLGEEKNLEAAIDNYEMALSLENRSASAEARIGLSLIEKYGKARDPILLDEAHSRCTAAQGRDDSCFEANLCLGEIHLNRNQVREALTYFERANGLDLNIDMVLERLELIYPQLNQGEKIETLLQRAIQRQPTLYRPRSRLGVYYLKSSRYLEAIEELNRVIQLAPRYGPAFNALGACYADLSCWEQALQMWQQARASGEDRDVIDTNVATALFFSGRFVEALEEAETALLFLDEKEAADDEYLAYGNVADIYYWSLGGSTQKAVYCYRRAIELAQQFLKHHPGHIETLSYLALYYAMISAPERALDYLNQTLSSAPDHTKNLYRAALTHRVMGNQDESLALLEKYFHTGGRPRQVSQEPAFDQMRKLPGYQEVASRYPDPSGCPGS
jgi:tetratricopeptide (TPR) repeat protein